MSIIKAKVDYSVNGPNDEYYTPIGAVKMIIPYIPKQVRTIWECTAIKESRIVEVLRYHGYEVIPSHIDNGKDFLTYEPDDYDMTITNPPYSLKDKFLKRAFELKKPFMFLLPITTLEGKNRNKMFRENGIQLLIPDIRFSFTSGEGSGAWFQTSWFTHGLRLKNDLIFVPVNDKEHSPVNELCTGRSVINLNNEIRQAA
jgi:hypothetical protein